MQKLVHDTVDGHEGEGTPRVRLVPAHVHTYVLAAVLALAFPSLAHAATRHVADTGNDGPNCGLALSTACRSITQAISFAAPGDTILVGPGRYGDLNRNGALGDIAGEESGSPGCGCVLSINKNVIVIASAGAAVTMIDGRSVDVNVNVLVITVGGEFGRPGKGFTVTETARKTNGVSSGHGIVLDSGDVMVRGNQVIFTRLEDIAISLGTGILTVNDAAIRIEGNQVIRWQIGISGRGAATVSKNQVLNNLQGISATGGSVVGNVATGNDVGFDLSGTATAMSNTAYLNAGYGFQVTAPFSGVFAKNNMFGNGTISGNCGLFNHFVTGLSATNNYWGAPTGPGAAPANSVCFAGGTTTTSPFATKPFAVKVLKP